MKPKYDYSIDALIKPGNDDHFFQFDHLPRLICNSQQFEISNACLLIELCRLIYRNDVTIYSKQKRISLITEILDSAEIEWIDCFKNDEHDVHSWLLKTSAFDSRLQKTIDCLVLVFRGTVGLENWKRNADTRLTEHPNGGRVHSGFYQCYQSIESQLNQCPDLSNHPIFITGHSLGAALATLSGYGISQSNKQYQAVYSFGAPKPGDEKFIEQMKSITTYRVVHRNDIVSMLPFDFINKQYQHTGQTHYFTEDKHYIDFTEQQIIQSQQSDFPQMKELTSFESIFSSYKNLEKEIPTYLSDHAPINYLRRLHLSYEMTQ